MDTMPPTTRRTLLRQSVAGVLGGCTILLTQGISVRAANLPQSYAPAGSKPLSLESLVPILQLDKDLGRIEAVLGGYDKAKDIQALQRLIDSIPSKEQDFKAVFDAYSIPVSYKQKFLDQNAFLVYYTKGFDGPGRRSIEDDLPVLQTQQYGYRNDVWVAWDSFLAEYAFVLQNTDEDDWGELVRSLAAVRQAVEAYLSTVPPDQRTKGTLMLS